MNTGNDILYVSLKILGELKNDAGIPRIVCFPGSLVAEH